MWFARIMASWYVAVIAALFISATFAIVWLALGHKPALDVYRECLDARQAQLLSGGSTDLGWDAFVVADQACHRPGTLSQVEAYVRYW
jgi:hypothetical protein